MIVRLVPRADQSESGFYQWFVRPIEDGMKPRTQESEVVSQFSDGLEFHHFSQTAPIPAAASTESGYSTGRRYRIDPTKTI